ncbi:AlpA family transcriptional regulator [Dechloromonas sp. H13]|uniref:helix-turn-helix transcriptional regulator n=1 Tax=Dechloromonas sp. H13 TaxID=2570193 RepID=UPI00129189AD|nr:AlpA family transcriptional regulator [Dechloromonas sp. H13]
MQNQTNESAAARPAIERVPMAARRMGVSVSQVYREIKAGRLGPLVKIGERASALPAAAVDAWIQSKINAAGGAK